MWAKIWQPFYEEVAHTPLFIWDPRCGKRNERRQSLVQTIDMPATLLEFFDVPLAADMLGKPLRDTIAKDAPVRDAGLFGVFGGHINVTDGRYVYMRAPATQDNQPLFHYTYMPTGMREFLSVETLRRVELAEPFAFTKGCRLMKYPGKSWFNHHQFGTLLFDLEADPGQTNPLKDAAMERRMVDHMLRLMRECDAPAEQHVRVGLPSSSHVAQSA
jgi:hypothetical protein